MLRAPWIACSLLIAAVVIASVLFYPKLPDRVPVHWDINGQVNGYGSKLGMAIFWPSLMAGLAVLLFVLPYASPKQFEVESFRSTYDLAALGVVGFLAYVYALTLWAALSRGPVDVGRGIIGGVSLLFLLIGLLLKNVRRNFWMGVRTPWTLASERVWNDTHRLAGRLFAISGLFGLVLALLIAEPKVLVIATLSLFAIAAIVPVVYSLVRYKQLQRCGEI